MNGLVVEQLVGPRTEVDYMVRERHYLHKWPAVTVATLALMRGYEAVGVCVFSMPTQAVIQRYGGLTWELARLWVRDEEPTNTESWFISQAVKWVRKTRPDVIALVSWADLEQGHMGIIYQASSWTFDGMSSDHRKPIVDGKHHYRASRVRGALSDPSSLKAVRRVRRTRKIRYVKMLRGPQREPVGTLNA